MEFNDFHCLQQTYKKIMDFFCYILESLFFPVV